VPAYWIWRRVTDSRKPGAGSQEPGAESGEG
jgi:hypothetical protein